MRTFKELENKIGEDKILDIRTILEGYIKNKYDYLAIPFSAWEDLTVNIIEEKIIKTGEEEFYSSILDRELEQVVRNYVLKQIKLRNIRIFNNLVIKLDYIKEPKMFFSRLIREFELLNIYFTSEIYEWLKNDSPELKKILEANNLFDLSLDEILAKFKIKVTLKKAKKKVEKVRERKVKVSEPVKMAIKSDMGKKIMGLYERFPDSEFVTPEEKIFIVDFLVGNISEDKRKQISDYLNGLPVDSKPKVFNFLTSLKSQYEQFINKGNIEELQSLYLTIRERREAKYFAQDLESKDSKDVFDLLGADNRIGLRKRKEFTNRILAIANSFIANGDYSKKEFIDSLNNIINSLRGVPITNEKEYINVILSLIFEKNDKKTRA